MKRKYLRPTNLASNREIIQQFSDIICRENWKLLSSRKAPQLLLTSSLKFPNLKNVRLSHFYSVIFSYTWNYLVFCVFSPAANQLYPPSSYQGYQQYYGGKPCKYILSYSGGHIEEYLRLKENSTFFQIQISTGIIFNSPLQHIVTKQEVGYFPHIIYSSFYVPRSIYTSLPSYGFVICSDLTVDYAQSLLYG